MKGRKGGSNQGFSSSTLKREARSGSCSSWDVGAGYHPASGGLVQVEISQARV